jgi:hypothetical protein
MIAVFASISNPLKKDYRMNDTNQTPTLTKHNFLQIALPATFAGLIGIVLGYYIHSTCILTPKGMSSQEYSLRTNMNKAWINDVVWIRQLIVSTAAGLGDTQEVTHRLLKNQETLGALIAPFYGQEASTRYIALLKDLITLDIQLIPAAKALEEERVKNLEEQWHTKANEIATFLHDLNPNNWSQKGIKTMFNEHLEVTTKELQYRLTGHWADDIANFELVLEQALLMSQEFATGIVKQFPDKF